MQIIGSKYSISKSKKKIATILQTETISKKLCVEVCLRGYRKEQIASHQKSPTLFGTIEPDGKMGKLELGSWTHIDGIEYPTFESISKQIK